ncbi:MULTISPECIES: hypothetical protein [unclassified Nocardiopsis]|uniref:hypothetical protein n=1 Tax=unclassified Nocardiopsis TaxID=2649073 RepID=UPI0033C23393
MASPSVSGSDADLPGVPVEPRTSAWWIPVWVLSACVCLAAALTTHASLFLVALHSLTWGLAPLLFWLWPLVWLLVLPVGLTHFVLVCLRRPGAMRRGLLVAQAVMMALYLATTWGLVAVVAANGNLFVV